MNRLGSNPNLARTIGVHQQAVKAKANMFMACNVTLQILYDIYCLML